MVGNFFHGMFFFIMGTRGGFPAIFVAQVTVAFARAILNGELTPLLFQSVVSLSLSRLKEPCKITGASLEGSLTHPSHRNEYFAIVPKHLSYSFSLWGAYYLVPFYQNSSQA
jgi:hypothetical protein